MALLWVLLWSVICDLVLVLVSGLSHCNISEDNTWPSASPLLDSLKCFNDYKSHVHCTWKNHTKTALQLCVETPQRRQLCSPYEAANAAEPGTVHCRFEADLFAIGVRHKAIFVSSLTESFCSSVPHTPTDLLQHLRARPPVNLSASETGDGGRRLHWSSPYPPSSSLTQNLTYQFSYRMKTEDSWTTETLTNTSVKLEQQLLLPGRWFEARVRARAGVSRWSHWSSVVSWKTKDDFKQVPTLHCVLDGEREVTCSWEVSRELAYIVTYQLACRYQHEAAFERCCLNPKVVSDLSGAVMRYSCSLETSEPEHLHVDLILTYNNKTFMVHQHIQPNPPQQVNVREKGRNWMVEWTTPPTAPELCLWYQVCYYKTQDQESAVLLNVSERLTNMVIPGTSLTPLEDYQVKVRSLVVPKFGSSYEGIPSEWTDPVTWTSHEASWSISTLVYVLISATVAIVFLTLYCTIPACRRRVILWVDSVPSPGKSKILSEIKTDSCQTHMQSEKTFICKVQNVDSMSTWSSDALLWPSTDNKCVSEDEGCCTCNVLPPPVDGVQSRDSSAMGFSGPYIFCQVSPAMSKSSNSEQEDDKETPPDVSPPPPHVPFTCFGAGYVSLPGHSVSRSAEDLTLHSGGTLGPPWCDSPDKVKTSSATTVWPVESDGQSSLCEPTSGTKPPDCISGPLMPWPPVGMVQESGYCHLPPSFKAAGK